MRCIVWVESWVDHWEIHVTRVYNPTSLDRVISGLCKDHEVLCWQWF